jgi:uncharacterized protein with PQ loop repeat
VLFRRFAYLVRLRSRRCRRYASRLDDVTGSTTVSALAHYDPRAVPLWLSALAVASGGLGLVSHWPQVWRIWVGRRHVGLSALSCVLNTLTSYSWLAYGVGLGSAAQITTNGAALAGALGILAGLVWLARPRVREWLPALGAGVVTVLGAAYVGGVGAVGWIASAITLGMAVPQVVLLVRRRRARQYDNSGVSRSRWLLSVVCNVGWASYALFTRDRAIGVTASTMVVLSAAVLVLCRPASAPSIQPGLPEPAGTP